MKMVPRITATLPLYAQSNAQQDKNCVNMTKLTLMAVDTKMFA